MTVYIDPRSSINYSSYYVQGLYDCLGKSNVHFSSKYFKDLKNIDILMAFVLITEGRIKKIIIDYRDQDDILEEAYSWTDVYAKINVSESTLRKNSDKILNIPPSFAIKIWNPVELGFYLCRNFLKAKIIYNINNPNIHIRPKIWVRNYLTLLKRKTLDSYSQKESDQAPKNYVFFISTLWQGADNTNLHRKKFILSCAQKQEVNFEGGFFMLKGTTIPDGIPKNLLFSSYFPYKLYLKNMKKSIFTFNTPAVLNCHGWKLGEFLCMGKAIISTPLINKIPFPLEHGNEILIVNNDEEMTDAITLLLENEELRKSLEKKSRAYFEKYVSPVKVTESILQYQPV